MTFGNLGYRTANTPSKKSSLRQVPNQQGGRNVTLAWRDLRLSSQFHQTYMLFHYLCMYPPIQGGKERKVAQDCPSLPHSLTVISYPLFCPFPGGETTASGRRAKSEPNQKPETFLPLEERRKKTKSAKQRSTLSRRLFPCFCGGEGNSRTPKGKARFPSQGDH